MTEFPLVSVIMPIRNEADFIARSLGAVLAQDYPRLEVLVADGMSTDLTRTIIAQLVSSSGIAVSIIDNPGGIVPTGFNAALAHAKGDIIVRVDGHTVIAPNYLRMCVDTLQRSGADNVGGRMNPIASGRFGEAAALATSSPFGVGGGRFHYSEREEWVDTVYMGAWRRDVFERIGAFDVELVRNQDDEFNYRLLSHGGQILLNPAITSRYYNRSTPRSLWRQYFQYGYWKIRVMQKHPRQMRMRQFAPPGFAAALIGSGLLATRFSSGRTLFGFVIGAYTLANGAASAWTASRRGWRHLPLLPFVFAILHLSYGLGFLWGLVRFWKRWMIFGVGATHASPLQIGHEKRD